MQEQIDKINSELRALRAEKNEIERQHSVKILEIRNKEIELNALAPFQPRDEVLVTALHAKAPIVCYIGSVGGYSNRSDGFYYRFNKAKKNGEMSAQRQYFDDDIVRIERI